MKSAAFYKLTIVFNVTIAAGTKLPNRCLLKSQEKQAVDLKPHPEANLARIDPGCNDTFRESNEAQGSEHRVIKQSNTWHAETPPRFHQKQQPAGPFLERYGEQRDQFYTQRATSFDGREGPPRMACQNEFQQIPEIFGAASHVPRFPPSVYQAPGLSLQSNPFRPPTGMPPPSPATPHQAKRFLAVDQELQKCVGESKGKCVALGHPLPRKFQGNMEMCKDEEVPEFSSLVNFPTNSVLRQNRVLPNGMRCCVMCGSIRRTCSRLRTQKPDGSLSPGRNMFVGGTAEDYVTIPTQNKGLCTVCDISVWVVLESGQQIKWCKGCKNFRPWAGFGDKGLATKCVRCRERQREKYAQLKDAKKKKTI